MTEKKAVVFVEGNTKQSEQFIHELSKLISEANAQPELTASLQTEQVETTGTDIDLDSAFESASND